MDTYCTLGALPLTTMTRYAVLSGSTVLEVIISRPDGIEVQRPAVLRWKRADGNEHVVKRYAFNNPAPMQVNANGQQMRKPTWRRAGRRVKSND